jgi:hypothetical protein
MSWGYRGTRATDAALFYNLSLGRKSKLVIFLIFLGNISHPPTGDEIAK